MSGVNGWVRSVCLCVCGSVLSQWMACSDACADFRLKPTSPALAMGIRSLDVSRVGPRTDWRRGRDP